MQRFAHFAIAAAAALTMTAVSAHAQSRWGQVWGTWVGEFELAPGMKVPALVTINIDGTMTGASGFMFGGVPNAASTSTPFFGIWQRTGWKRTAGTSISMVFDRVTGVLTGFMRSRSTAEFADDFNSYTGTESIESLLCPSPVACPDPLDPSAAWQPMPGVPPSVPVSGKRVEVVKTGG